MLCQFTFKNFKSFRDEAVLDMQAVAISEHENSLLVDSDGQRFLPLAALYGPNGSGKSTVLEAFVVLVSIIMRPIYVLKNANEVKNKNTNLTTPFKFDPETIEAPTEFTLFFRTTGVEYRYNLHIKKQVIIYESLYKQNINGKRASKIFVRNHNAEKIDTGPLLKSMENIGVADTIPFLAYLKILKDIDTINEIIAWFERCEFVNFGNPFYESRIFLFENDKIQNIMFKIIQEMDSDISSFRYKKGDKEDEYEIFTKHVVQEQEYELELQEESSGTIKLFACLPFVIQALMRGGVIVIDELDAKLHPKLIRYIIELFSNPCSNPHKAQLIFTSHDLSTMKKEVFRRDEIWFVAKDSRQSSKLYSLVEFKDQAGNGVRKDATFDKQYLEGRYGADPYLRCCLNWEAEL
ncbi:AAA family ATPase [Sporomusa termitida]|uniref:AAA domain, putative AbiEii toxin, Type IV TA system n=1 Tax=Sporomusa termitida TaxID=2377 RepID=A0A517DQA4_9FIRM|nr:ATP-binding protein [Sporomusa termitida]QDR79507.1 AAA domain, putative AbiEii toxin, Type IV TA system [Sporomusa termitida]